MTDHKDARQLLADITADVTGQEWVNAVEGLFDKMAQRIAELEAERQWQPIETAPKDGTLICICCFKAAAAFKHFEGVARIDKWDANYSGGFGGFNPLTFPATHWMPLPASPHEGTQS